MLTHASRHTVVRVCDIFNKDKMLNIFFCKILGIYRNKKLKPVPNGTGLNIGLSSRDDGGKPTFPQ